MSQSVMPTYARAPLVFNSGKGSWLAEAGGAQYLDFGAGVAVNALGHAHPELVDTLKGQAEKLWHTSNLYNVSNQQLLADALCEASFADRVFFTNSGTEAMECAVKAARKFHHDQGAPQRCNIITFTGGFHGRTLAMISSTRSAKMVNGFAPLMGGFVQVPFGDLEAVENAIDDRVGAIMLEPILGEGGIIPLPIEQLKALRGICDRHGLLLILDEIQCGIGRTGKLFAHEWAKITPDIMGIAKGIGAGFPLGACLCTKDAASGMVAGTHGSTFGGNPLACAIGAKVLSIINDDDFLADVRQKSTRLRKGVEDLITRYPNSFELVRGMGLMLGLKCKRDNIAMVNAAYAHKLLTVPASDNVVRLIPPLNISNDEIDEALLRLSKAADDVEAAHA